MTIGERIKKLREDKKISQSELARMAGENAATINRIESGGIKDPSFSSVVAIANALEVHIDKLTGEHWGNWDATDVPISIRDPGAVYGKKLKRVPIVSWVHAGEACTYEEMTGEHIEYRYSEVADPRAFGVEVEGDSMEPKIYHGDVVIACPSHEPQTGNIVIAKLRNRGVVLRLFADSGNGGKSISLTPYNQLYPKEHFAREDFWWIYPVKEHIHKWM